MRGSLFADGHSGLSEPLGELKPGKEHAARAFALDQHFELIAHIDQEGIQLTMSHRADAIGKTGPLELLQPAGKAQPLQEAGLRRGKTCSIRRPALAAPVVEGGKIYVARNILFADAVIGTGADSMFMKTSQGTCIIGV